MATEAVVRLVVYSRPCCHLCDEMIAGLQAMHSGGSFWIDIVDIGGEPALERRYGAVVPACGGREFCRHCLDRAAITAPLAEIR